MSEKNPFRIGWNSARANAVPMDEQRYAPGEKPYMRPQLLKVDNWHYAFRGTENRFGHVKNLGSREKEMRPAKVSSEVVEKVLCCCSNKCVGACFAVRPRPIYDIIRTWQALSF